MQEEIFGPILPVLEFDDIRQAFEFVRMREKPLAAYLFTKSKETEREFLSHVSFGGGCVSDTVLHLTTSQMGFGVWETVEWVLIMAGKVLRHFPMKRVF